MQLSQFIGMLMLMIICFLKFGQFAEMIVCFLYSVCLILYIFVFLIHVVYSNQI